MESQDFSLHHTRKALYKARTKNVALLLVALFLFGLLRSSNSFPHDLQINLSALQNLRQTGILYNWSPNGPLPLYYSFISSPFVAVLLYPLAFLDLNSALSVYRLCSVLIYVLAIILLSRIHNLTINSNTAIAGWSWLILIGWLPAKDSFDLGQLNEFIFFWLVIAYWGWMTNRDIATGIGIGCAAAVKISPILLILLFVFSGRWRAAVVAIIVAALLGSISCAAVGVNQCVAFSTTIFPAISRGSADWYHIGLNGLWYRLLTINQTTYWTDFQPPPVIAGQILPTAELLMFIVAGYVVTRRVIQNDQNRSALMALWVGGLLLSSPVTWWHYAVWLLIGIPTLVEFALSSNRRARWGIGLGLLLINTSPYILLGFGLWTGSYLLTYFLLTLPCVGLVILTAFFWHITSSPFSLRS